jgi:hypothetical protein
MPSFALGPWLQCPRLSSDGMISVEIVLNVTADVIEFIQESDMFSYMTDGLCANDIDLTTPVFRPQWSLGLNLFSL